MINVGVIGCGHWGPNHIRIFSQLPDSNTLMCADLDQNRLTQLSQQYVGLKTTTDYKDILSNPDIDAVCVSAPTNLHYELSKESLEAGKHVLCEKPLALTAAECEELQEVATAHDKIMMVGHVFVFNAGIVWLKKLIESGDLGNIYYAYATRTNLGPFRYDVNALWDLAPHDISIFNYLFDAPPLNVSARGQTYLDHSLEDLAFATLEYPEKIIANIHVSWLDPKKVRQITIVGDKKMVVWDDLDNVGPIKLYDKHVEKTSTYYATYGEFQMLSREGSITIPKIGFSEPLKEQGRYFIECIKENRLPGKADAEKGRQVVATLHAIQKSMQLQGSHVVLDETSEVTQ
ncbi:MAG: Gfo/Idh/MocA family oxidoreductase [Candidatus Omnitrophica bacterium]|nr:Gfo/Idh/MocA family oxidoreductase [Candidatus Omnitrophota bacterium]